MKKTSLILGLTAVLASSVLVTSCKKDKSGLEILQSQKWKVSELKADTNGDGVVDTDVYATYDDCQKDNFFDFLDNGTLLEDEGATVCNVGDPQTTNNFYFLNADETKLYFDEEFYYNVISLEDSKLQLRADTPFVVQLVFVPY